MENTLTRKKQIITAKALTTVIGTTLSVSMPQLFHVIGIVSGTGSLPGSAFLPMHLGVFFTALLAGPAVGAVTGAVSPLLSFALTGMPSAALLPFMMIELTVYGVVCGLLKNKKMPVILKVLTAQILGRAIRAAAILIAFYGFKSTAVSPTIILSSIASGLPGLILQWTLLPLLIYRVKGLNKFYE